MASLEVQKQNIDTQIRTESSAAKASVNKSATDTTRKHQTTTVSKPTSSFKANTGTGYKTQVEAWRSKSLADINRQEESALKDVASQYQAAKNSPSEYDTTGLSDEEKTILKDHGVDEINRRRGLQAELQYSSALKASEDKMKKDYVKVAGNQWIAKEDYNALSDSDKELIQKIGVKQLQNIQGDRYSTEIKQIEQDLGMTDYQRATFEALPTVEAKNSYARMLSTIAQTTAISQFGLDIIKAAKEASKAQSIEEPKEELVYQVETSTGTIEVPAEEWDSKNTYQQLTTILGRAPSAAEMESVARPEVPGYAYTNLVKQLPVVGGVVGGFFENLRLGFDLIIPGPQSANEAYYQSTRGEAGRLLREYTQMSYPAGTLVPGGSTQNSAPGNWVERSILLGGELGGFPAVRGYSQNVQLKDISTEEWGSTALSVALLALPAAIKGFRFLKSEFQIRTAGVPRLIVTKSPLITWKFKAPVTLESSGVRNLRVASIETFKLKFQVPSLKASFHSPIKFSIGSGLEAAKIPKLLSQSALKSGSAFRALTRATKAAKNVEITSPRFPKLASTLDQARVRATALDTKFAENLQGISLTTKQIRLIERTTGYKGLGEAMAHLNVTGTAVSKAFKNLGTKVPNTVEYTKALTTYQETLYKMQAASENFSRFIQPRESYNFSRYSPKMDSGFQSVFRGLDSSLERVPTKRIQRPITNLDKLRWSRLKKKGPKKGTSSTGRNWDELLEPTGPNWDKLLSSAQGTKIGRTSLRGSKSGLTKPRITRTSKLIPQSKLSNLKLTRLQKRGARLPKSKTDSNWDELLKSPPSASKSNEFLRLQRLSREVTDAYYKKMGGKPLIDRGPVSRDWDLLLDPGTKNLYKTESQSIFGLDKALGERVQMRGYRTVTAPSKPVVKPIRVPKPKPDSPFKREPSPRPGRRPSIKPGRSTPEIGSPKEVPSVTPKDVPYKNPELVPDTRPPITPRPSIIPLGSPKGTPGRSPSRVPGTSPVQVPYPNTVPEFNPSSVPNLFTSPSPIEFTNPNPVGFLSPNPVEALNPNLVEFLNPSPIEFLNPNPVEEPVPNPVPNPEPRPTPEPRPSPRPTPKPTPRPNPKTKTGKKPPKKFPFLWPPASSDEDEVEKKKKKKKKKKYASYPGTYPGLDLFMPTPLAPIENLMKPRNIIKKTRSTVRRAGTYPIAGYKEVKV